MCDKTAFHELRQQTAENSRQIADLDLQRKTLCESVINCLRELAVNALKAERGR